MRAGLLRHVLSIQSYTATQNESGEEVKTWTTDFTVRARDIPKSSKEFFDAQQRIAELEHLFEVRYRADIGPKQRLLFGTTVLNIVGIPWNPDGKRVKLVIPAKERVPSELE